MKRWLLSLCVVGALGLGACDQLFDPDPDPASLAGSYQLTAVDGHPLPWQLAPDSTGMTITVMSGSLTLGAAPSDRYVFVPSGATMPSRCVHEIPNGAFVDTANVVHLPDGSSYKIPPCGNGPYALALTRSTARGDGPAQTATNTTSGLYAWGKEGISDAVTRVTLVGSGMAGSVATAGGQLSITVSAQHIGSAWMWPYEPAYTFTRAP